MRHQRAQMRGHRLVGRILELEFAQLGLDAAHVADAAEPVEIVEVMARALQRSSPAAAAAGGAHGGAVALRLLGSGSRIQFSAAACRCARAAAAARSA